MNTEKLAAFLAFLDDVIAKDAARTQGEFKIYDGNAVYVEPSSKYRLQIADMAPGDEHNFIRPRANASFIAGSSIWSALMANGYKAVLSEIDDCYSDCPALAQHLRGTILDAFPDSILKPFWPK